MVGKSALVISIFSSVIFSLHSMKRAGGNYFEVTSPLKKQCSVDIRSEIASHKMARETVFYHFSHKMKLDCSMTADKIEFFRSSFVDNGVIPEALLGALLQQYHLAWYNPMSDHTKTDGPELYIINGELVFK